jgi:hypothetical protein
MTDVGPFLALATIGALWIAIACALTISLRHNDPSDTLAEHLAAKTAPWRRLPENRTTHKDLPA